MRLAPFAFDHLGCQNPRGTNATAATKEVQSEKDRCRYQMMGRGPEPNLRANRFSNSVGVMS